MQKDFSYAQSIIPIEHKYPKSNIKKPYHESAVVIVLDGTVNAVMVQIITPLYKGSKVVPKEEIDVIHFGAKNVPQQPLHTLYEEEMMHMISESATIITDKINEVLKEKYPKAKKVKYPTRAELLKIYHHALKSPNKSDSGEGSFVNPTFGIA